MSRADWDAIRAEPEIGVGRPTPRAVRVIRRVVGPIVRLLFRPSIKGLEHLPSDRPFLLVANHSAGLGVAEIFSFTWLYIDRVGPERPLTALAHPEGFRMRPLSTIHRMLGTIPSTYAAAEEALADGVPILVFPGGGYETQRPFWQANRVDFGKRRGYVRIATKARVPIVPMAIRGSHHTAPILFRARWLASLLLLPRFLFGEKRWSLSLLGLVGAVALALTDLWLPLRIALIGLWLGTPLMFLPIIPWRIRFRVGPSVPIEDLGDDIDGIGRRVEAHIQRLLGSPRIPGPVRDRPDGHEPG